MADIVKTSDKPTPANTKKEKRNVTPKLICILTNSQRFTNGEYLTAKAANCGSVKRFVEHYVCSDAMKLLREGLAAGKELNTALLTEVRTKLKVKTEDCPMPSLEKMKIAMETNGKRKSKAKKVAAKSTEAKPKAAKTAPKPKAAPTAHKAPTTATGTTTAPETKPGSAGATAAAGS